MKKFFTIIAVALAACTDTMAQTTTDLYVDLGVPVLSTQKTYGYGIDTESDDFFSVGGGLDIATSLNKSQRFPLKIVYGISYNYTTKSDDGVDFTITDLMFPVNLKAAFRQNKKFGVEPYVGLNFSYYIDCKAKTTIDYFYGYGHSSNSSKYSESFIEDVNRFQVGVQTGVDFCICKKFVLGLKCIVDATEFESWEQNGERYNDNWIHFSMKLGYRF